MQIDIPAPVVMHDFAITEKYAIFLDLPLVFKEKDVTRGMPFDFDTSYRSAIGVLDRYAHNDKSISW